MKLGMGNSTYKWEPACKSAIGSYEWYGDKYTYT